MFITQLQDLLALRTKNIKSEGKVMFLFQKKYIVSWGIKCSDSKEFKTYAEALAEYSQRKRAGYKKVVLSERGINYRDTSVENIIYACNGV